jgi:hypothetical protein
MVLCDLWHLKLYPLDGRPSLFSGAHDVPEIGVEYLFLFTMCPCIFSITLFQT